MKKPATYYKFFLGFSLVLILISLAFLYQTVFKTVIAKNKNVQSKEIIYHIQQIKKLGAVNAYAEFKKQNKILNLTRQHNAVHFFGEALYSLNGLKGITICDSEFNYGCYHSVIGNALAQEGLGEISKINDYCLTTDDFLKCQHGIGHGVIAFLGYDFKNLTQALNICDGLKKRDPIGGCFTGIFMEYNFQTMLDTDGKTRPLNDSSPLYPCDGLPENFQKPCLYEQSNWWLEVLPDNFDNKINKIDTYCNKFDGAPKEACFIGLGVHLPNRTNWDSNKALTSCQKLKSPEAFSFCIYGLASEFYSRPEYAAKAKQLCDLLNPIDSSNCKKRVGINF